MQLVTIVYTVSDYCTCSEWLLYMQLVTILYAVSDYCICSKWLFYMQLVTILYAFHWSESVDFIRCNRGYTLVEGKSRFEPCQCYHYVHHVSCCPSQPGNWLPYLHTSSVGNTSTPPIRLRGVVPHALRTCDFVLPGLTLNYSAFCPHSVFCVDLRTNSHYFPIRH